MADKRLKERIAVVTGGASGIGKATAIRFAQHGAAVYILDLTPEKLAETKQEIESIGGSIIITSSINGNRVFSNIGAAAYSTSKAGQTAFMKMAALELAQYAIRVNAVCPGSIDTNIGKNTYKSEELEEVQIPVEFPDGNHPLEQAPGKPEQVANLVLFLASDESFHVTGTEIFVDGAESLLRG